MSGNKIAEFSLYHGLESVYSCAKVYIGKSEALVIDSDTQKWLEYMREHLEDTETDLEALKRLMREYRARS